MPDAVIVSTARTPIGRAAKGSLVDARPDDLAAFAVEAALAKVPRAAARGDRRRDDRLRLSAGAAGDEPRAARRAARRAAGDGAGHDGQPLLRVEPADDPHGLPRDQGRRGRGVRRGRRRVDVAGERLPEVGGGAPPRALRRRRADRERLHPDGPHRRERRRALGRLARGHGPVRAAVAGARRRGTGLGVLRARDHAVRGRRGRRRPAAIVDLREARRARARVQARREGHGRQRVPAERRRGGGRRHVGEPRRASSGSSRARASSPRACPASSRRSWASARSRRSARCSRRRA